LPGHLLGQHHHRRRAVEQSTLTRNLQALAREGLELAERLAAASEALEALSTRPARRVAAT
jgi:hypothetical protein